MKLLAIRLSPQAGKSLVMSKAAVPFMFRQAQFERHLYFGEFNEHTPLRPAAPELQILPDLAPPFSGMAQGRSHVYHRPHRRPDDLPARAGLRTRQPAAGDGRHFLHGVPRRRNDLLQHDEQRQFRIAVFRFRAHARAALAPAYDFFMYYFTLVITPMMLLCGVFFPVAQLPPLWQNVSAALPLTHAIDIARPLMSGVVPPSLLVHVTVLLGYALCAFYVSLVLFRRRLSK
jgi:uncharacterized protein (DUF983 family)